MKKIIPKIQKAIFDLDRFQIVAVIFFILFTSLILIYGSGDRAGLLLLGSPDFSHGGWLPGYAGTLGEFSNHEEQFSRFFHSFDLLNGGTNYIEWLNLRIMTSFFVNIFEPFFGLWVSFRIINYFAWAFAVWITWKLAFLIYREKQIAFFAAIMACMGFGFIIHIDDFGTHLSSFTFFYFGVYILYKSNVWKESCNLKTHLYIGFAIALIGLNYNNGIFLSVSYFLVAILNNRIWKVLTGFLIGVSASRLWHIYLNLHNIYVHKSKWVNLYQTEEDQFLGFRLFKTMFEPGLLEGLQSLFEFVLSSLGKTLAYESPVLSILVLIGLIYVFFIHRKMANGNKLTFFYVAVFFMPPIGTVIYLSFNPIAYIYFGISVIAYIVVSVLVFSLVRFHKFLGFSLLSLVLISQFSWNTLHFTKGNLSPINAFNYGLRTFYLKSALKNPKEVLSLTGNEPTPVLFNGSSRLVDAGLEPGPSKENKIAVSVKKAFPIRLFVYLYLGGFCFFYFIGRKRKTALIILGVVFIGSLISAKLFTKTQPPNPRSKNGVYNIHAEKITFKERLSDEFISGLKKHLETGDTFHLQFGLLGDYSTKIFLGKKELQVRDDTPGVKNWVGRWSVEPDKFIQLAEKDRWLTLEISAKSMTTVRGWQRIDLKDREFFVDGLVDVPGIGKVKRETLGRDTNFVLPYLEIRLADKDGVLKFVGF